MAPSKAVRGAVVIIDLDRFKEIVEEKGWSEYTPNPVTSELTALIKNLISKHFGVVIYGLDEERGTEEAVLEFPSADEEDLLKDLEEIRKRIEEVGLQTRSGATVSIGVVFGAIGVSKPAKRRDAYRATPLRLLALRALQKAKRMGGNRVVVL
ncbi:MAG TPA: GGDEF domain-containing protein [Candidatus Methanomethylia archaeon]|nr:GGDEF domain-containing protein [Candidatus Methanomethylicia archaeon]